MELFHFNESVLRLLAGGFLAMASAGLSSYFGYRSADRLPGESRWPQCVFCYRPFRWTEIFPFLGWILRTHSIVLPCPCGKRTWLWPLPVAEMTGFLMGVAIVQIVGWKWEIIPLCFGLGLLPAIALIDLAFGLIPDGLNLLLGVFGLAWLFISDGGVFNGLMIASGLLLFSLLLAVVYSKWRGKEMLGLGDVKFFTAAGLWLPPMVVPWFLALAGILGVGVGLLWKRSGGGKEFPFAPALCASLAVCVFYKLCSFY